MQDPFAIVSNPKQLKQVHLADLADGFDRLMPGMRWDERSKVHDVFVGVG